MKSTIEHTKIAGIDIILTRKTMRSIRMRVKRPLGEVHISAPHRMSRGFIESFVESRVAWIDEQRGKIHESPLRIPLEYRDGEIVSFLGEEYALRVVEGKGKMRVEKSDFLDLTSTV